MPHEPLTTQQVLHVARLARLELTSDQVQQYRQQLSDVLDHVATLSSVDVEGVMPMAHPIELTNRLADDIPVPSMPLEDLLANAPAIEGDYLAVPKVFGGGGGGD
jgi:aspartyl-tRNA(Asn)/glutamyl-tRNA(Gln) amidotransferase subunit C